MMGMWLVFFLIPVFVDRIDHFAAAHCQVHWPLRLADCSRSSFPLKSLERNLPVLRR